MQNILILHGWGSSARKWQRVKELFEKGGYNVFVPDLPGFGENPLLDKPWVIDDYVLWVKEYCGRQVEPFFLIGHSFGGNIAFHYALKFPQDIKKLILVDPALIRVADWKKEAMAKISHLVNKFSFLPFYSLVRDSFYRFIVRSDYPDTEGVMRETYLMIVKRDFSEYLSRISVPTLLVWGQKDDITPLKDAYFVKERVPNSKLEILPGIHHSPQIEAPELLVKRISENL